MKKLSFLLTASLIFSFAQVEACTSLLAGRNATTDGSTFITYSADSHTLYGALPYFPAATYPKGTLLDITDWDTGKPLGSIAQVERTYAVIGHMNEYQVSVTESTWGGRPELQDTTGVVDYGSLMYIALQRSRTAREAIKVMTDLVKKYGYNSTGESFSIADPNEVWIMEMIGKGPHNKGAVWVAVRIPDDCISAHANHSRIHTFPLDDKENCMYSPDVISFAREKGYFNGLNKDFSFSNAYAPADFGALRACEARVWSFFRKYNKNMDSYLSYIKGESKTPIPLYIKPDRKLSVQDMKNGMRDHFEGTPFDMTQDIGAGPFKSPYRFRPMTFKVDGQEYVMERAIATQQTGFTLVAQMRSWLPDAIGGVLWFGVDDANTCIYVPIYCCTTEVPECFSPDNGSLLKLSWTSAFWVHNWVANMAYDRYNLMIEDIRPVQEQIETDFNTMQPIIDKAATEMYKNDKTAAIRFLTAYSVAQAQQTTARWKDLGEYLLVKYLDGNRKKEKDGKFMLNPYGKPESPDFPGYSEEYYRAVAKDAGDRLKVTF
ncbi:C69 family dipeptidase [Coprobacter tertius]|uniref:Dipeptidase n=1 Tax=Coprobacter tertius TaxID=2944915 RepID=A0ABT1MHT5_9BACT|nr:C69 family dipeptidase [Coprobacter tertius]MCP9611939.1 C69 family dipeptidase [Coprobacter tertius]